MLRKILDSMIKQGSTADLRRGRIKKSDGHIVVTMRYYPRGMSKELSDEYVVSLSPEKELFKEWQTAVAEVGHDGAFKKVDYLKRFEVSALAFAYLKRFAHIAREKDVYFICQCEVGEMCHREILMKIAETVFHAKTGEIFHKYDQFMERIPKLLSEAQFDPSLDYRE